MYFTPCLFLIKYFCNELDGRNLLTVQNIFFIKQTKQEYSIISHNKINYSSSDLEVLHFDNFWH